MGAQTLCIALLLALAATPARADCPAAPIGDPDDMAISFLAANAVQVASSSLLASSVKEGTLVYDDAANKLKLCDGTNWVAVGTGAGTDTLASLSCTTGEIAKFNGSAWACAADGGGSGAATYFRASRTDSQSIANSTWATMLYTTQDNDEGGDNYNPVTGVFTAPSDGFYQFNAFASGGWVTTTSLLSMYVRTDSGTKVCWDTNSHSDGSASMYGYVSCSGAVYLTAGSTVSTQVYQASGSAKNFGGGFSGFKIGVGGGDTLFGLSCTSGQIPKWNGSAWACAADGGGSGSITPVATSAPISNQTTTSNAFVDMPGASITFTSNGLPVLVMANFTSYSNTAAATGTFQLVIDGAVESTYTLQYPSNATVMPTQMQALKALSAGSHTAKIRWLTSAGTLTANWNSGSTSIIAHEIGGGGSGSGGGGATTLAALSDVNISSPTDGQVLKYDNASSKWINGTASGGATPAGTVAGAVQFRGSSAVFAADDVNLIWDNTTKRLGIGIATPNRRLDIVTNNSSTQDMIVHIGEQTQEGGYLGSFAPADLLMSGGADFSNGWLARDTSASSLRLLNGTALFFANSGLTPGATFTPSERMRIDANGNVGIGTTNPLTGLHVVKDDGDGYAGWFQKNTSSAGVGIGSFGSASMVQALSSDGSTVAALNLNPKGGNVGIGTAAPATNLDVQADGNSVIASRSFGSGGIAGHFVGFRARGTKASPTQVLNGDPLGTFQGRPYLSSGIWPGMTIVATEDYTTIAQGSAVSFSTSTNGTVVTNERMRIDHNGNVGIGTTSPSARLHISTVSGSPSIPALGAINAFTSQYLTNSDSTYGLLSGSLFNGNSWMQAQRTDGTATAYNLLLQPNGGKVGIGTTSPTELLHMKSSTGNAVALMDAGSTLNSGMYLYRSGALKWYVYNQGTNDRLYAIDAGADNGAYMDQNASGWSAFSDRRMKENIQSYDVLKRLDSFRAVSFDWKNSGRHDVGVIAQDVYKAFPEIVDVGDDDPDRKIHDVKEPGVWGVNYEKLGALSMQGVSELYAIVKDLKADNDNLRAELKAANDNYEDLRRQIDALNASR